MSELEANSPEDATPDELRAARDEFFAGMASLERAAWSAGWDAGHKAGWNAAFEYIYKRFDEERNAAVHKPPTTPDSKEHRIPDAVRGSEKGAPNAKVAVFDLIQRRPGLRGVELVSALKNEGVEMLERTVRTALWRLKSEDKIKTVDGRWYTLESAPPDPPSSEEEDS